MSENTEPIESKNEVESKQEVEYTSERPTSQTMFDEYDKFDLWKISSEVDPETGLDLDFIQVREYICEHGPAKGLEPLYEYYLTKFHKLDPWSVYLLACSHFTLEELEGTPINRSYRRRLEQKVKKLMKAREKDSSSSYQEFLYKNRHIDV